MGSFHKQSWFFFALISLHTIFSISAHATGGDLKFDCVNGSAKGTIGGEEVKIDCGANTPTKKGKIEAMHPCVGSAFPCMAGKDCIDIQGGIKFHRTNCGSGGAEATGQIKTAGCVVLGDKDFDKLKSMVGQEYDLKGPGGGGGR